MTDDEKKARRERIATAALQALIPLNESPDPACEFLFPDGISFIAVCYADGLIAELDAPPDPNK